MFKRLVCVLGIVIGALFCAGITHAQVPTQDTTVSITPQNPGPNQSVDITLSSYSSDLSAATITWTVDGKKVLDGIGYDHYTLTTKNLGQSTTITIAITPINDQTTTKSITLIPAEVDMLWQATDSIVPPLYRGKAMPTSESKVRFVAIPQVLASNGSLLAPGTFLYNWQEEFGDAGGDSGYGKDFYETDMDYLNPTKHISVDLTARDGTPVASSALALDPSDPGITWYASSALTGPIFDRALSDNQTIPSGTSLYAEPYFFSPKNTAAPVLKYEWQLNGQTPDSANNQNSIFLQKGSDSSNSVSVGLTTTNLAKLFQEATSNINLLLQ